jgi:hypothetical protein
MRQESITGPVLSRIDPLMREYRFRFSPVTITRQQSLQKGWWKELILTDTIC